MATAVAAVDSEVFSLSRDIYLRTKRLRSSNSEDGEQSTARDPGATTTKKDTKNNAVLYVSSCVFCCLIFS